MHFSIEMFSIAKLRCVAKSSGTWRWRRSFEFEPVVTQPSSSRLADKTKKREQIMNLATAKEIAKQNKNKRTLRKRNRKAKEQKKMTESTKSRVREMEHRIKAKNGTQNLYLYI